MSGMFFETQCSVRCNQNVTFFCPQNRAYTKNRFEIEKFKRGSALFPDFSHQDDGHPSPHPTPHFNSESRIFRPSAPEMLLSDSHYKTGYTAFVATGRNATDAAAMSFDA